MKKLTILFIALLLATTLSSCGKNREGNQKTGDHVQVKVLATVNDVPITEYDLKQFQKRIPAGMGGIHQGADQNILQTLVRDELIYQKSLELGLDKNEAYRQKLTEVEAELRGFKRQEMSALYRRHVREKAVVTDAEVQAYFEKNVKKMQTKFRIWEIFARGNEAQIVKDLQDVKKGIPFEKVAARRFVNLPPNMKAPWDLGEMHWSQIPEPWQGALEGMAPGQVSDVIKGPKDRFWVIKLVGKTVDPQITLATEKAKIVEILSQQKAAALYDDMLAQMKSKAKIVFSK